jgi:quercetin dioxygenase-like cupin family protein
MYVVDSKSCEQRKVEEFPYRGKMHKVIGTSIRWLSRYGDDGHGFPDYGLRYFTVEPEGEIPIHNHFYHQTMYILDGAFECLAFDADTDELVDKKICTAGTSVFIPSMEPHGMKNIGDEPASFLCCICNVYDREESI